MGLAGSGVAGSELQVSGFGVVGTGFWGSGVGFTELIGFRIGLWHSWDGGIRMTGSGWWGRDCHVRIRKSIICV